MNKETGGPAFPQYILEPNPAGGEPRIVWQEGMTLRDYFAAKAMQGILASFTSSQPDMDITAKVSYKYADEMLKAREQ